MRTIKLFTSLRFKYRNGKLLEREGEILLLLRNGASTYAAIKVSDIRGLWIILFAADKWTACPYEERRSDLEGFQRWLSGLNCRGDLPPPDRAAPPLDLHSPLEAPGLIYCASRDFLDRSQIQAQGKPAVSSSVECVTVEFRAPTALLVKLIWLLQRSCMQGRNQFVTQIAHSMCDLHWLIIRCFWLQHILFAHQVIKFLRIITRN